MIRATGDDRTQANRPRAGEGKMMRIDHRQCDHFQDTLERRRELCSQAVTLDGAPAVLSGAARTFAMVRPLPRGAGYQWAWETAERIMANGGEFKS